LPIILKGILSNSSLSNRFELIAALEQMSQPNPEAQQAQQMSQQLDMAAKQAEVQKTQAEAQKAQAEAAATPDIAKAKVIAALSNNLNEDNESKDFEKRVRITELMLKEKDLGIKEQDSIRNERITMMQMEKNNKSDEEFTKLMSNG
jgi:hypothetical protein